jgi:hypothetical protein
LVHYLPAALRRWRLNGYAGAPFADAHTDFDTDAYANPDLLTDPGCHRLTDAEALVV